MFPWNDIVADLGPRLFRYFVGSFPSAQAEDLVQETLLRLVRKVRSGQFNSSRGTMAMYAFGIAHFVRKEMLRNPGPATLDVDMAELPSYEEDAASQYLQRRQLRKAISALPQEQQEALLLYIDEELSMSEIGCLLDMNENTVKSHIHRAKQQLTSLLQGDLP